MKKLYNIINVIFLGLIVMFTNKDNDNIINNNNTNSTTIDTSVYIKINNVYSKSNDINKLYFTINDIKECYKIQINDVKIDFINDYSKHNCLDELVIYDDNIQSIFMIKDDINDIIFKEISFDNKDIIFSYIGENISNNFIRGNDYEIIWNVKDTKNSKLYFDIIKDYDPLYVHFASLFDTIYDIIDTFRF